MSINITGVLWQPNVSDAINSGVSGFMQEIYDIARNSMTGKNGRDKGIDCLAVVGIGQAGTLQQETNTIGGAAGASTNLPVTVTDPSVPALAAGKVINVAVLNGDSPSAVAIKVASALGADPDVSAKYTAQSVGADYWIVTINTQANDPAINLGHGAITGIAASANSTTTTPGVAASAELQTLDFSAKFTRVDFITISTKDTGATADNISFYPDSANPAILYVKASFETISSEYLINVYGELKR